MTKAFITGITGTVAPYIKRELECNGYTVYDKHFHINDEDFSTLNAYLNHVKPDIILHLALGPLSYTRVLAEYAKNSGAKFLYVSTVSVFEDNNGGPYTKNTKVLVENDYGTYKFENEQLVKEVKPDSYIVRIGWQISETGDTDSNNMFQYIKNNIKDNTIIVSDQFYPSASFLNQTAKAIVDIVTNKKPKLYLVNSNYDKSLYEIVTLLNKQFNLNLTIKSDSNFKRNDIMIDNSVSIKKI